MKALFLFWAMSSGFQRPIKAEKHIFGACTAPPGTRRSLPMCACQSGSALTLAEPQPSDLSRLRWHQALPGSRALGVTDISGTATGNSNHFIVLPRRICPDPLRAPPAWLAGRLSRGQGTSNVAVHPTSHPRGTLLGCPPWSSLAADKAHPPLNAAAIPHPLGTGRSAGPVEGGGRVITPFQGNTQPWGPVNTHTR